MRAKIERFADFLGLCNVSLDDDRDVELGHERLDESPGRRTNAGSIGGVSAESSSYDVGAGTLRGDSVSDGGDIGAGGAAEFSMNATDDFGPGLRFDQPAVSAVESDDVGAGVADGLGRLEVRSDVDIAVSVVGLGDADDGQISQGTERCDAWNAFGTETTGSSAKNRSGHASEGVEVIERVSCRCLTGDDELAAERLED